jgi:replicative DNA helicase
MPSQPRANESERYVLGSMLELPDAVEYVADRLSVDDFYHPLHQRLAGVILTEHLFGRATDHVAIIQRCIELTYGEHLSSAFIYDLLRDLPLKLGSLSSHVTKIRDMTERRAILSASVRTAMSALQDHEIPAPAIVASGVDHLEKAVLLSVAVAEKPPTLKEYLAIEVVHNWLIPDLIATHERILVTASEGLGKSTILRQLAVCSAAGIHPFTDANDLESRRVLVIDCENPIRLNQHRYGTLAARANQTGRYPDSLWVESPGRNLDLTRPRDQAWVMHQVRCIEPELLMIGPIYKLHTGSPEEETPARQVIEFIDHLIDKYGCAVIMEAHTPWGPAGTTRPLRPIGSTIWARWPDFGIGLRAVGGKDDRKIRPDRLCKVEQWKYRDERHWPVALRAGGTWPWIPVDEAELELMMSAP